MFCFYKTNNVLSLGKQYSRFRRNKIVGSGKWYYNIHVQLYKKSISWILQNNCAIVKYNIYYQSKRFGGHADRKITLAQHAEKTDIWVLRELAASIFSMNMNFYQDTQYSRCVAMGWKGSSICTPNNNYKEASWNGSSI